MKKCSEANCKKTSKRADLCSSHAQARWRSENKAKLIEYFKKRYENNKEEIKSRSKKWATCNPERRALISKSYHAKNPCKRVQNESVRRSKIKLATPTWVDVGTLTSFYNNKPLGLEVDHIVPINNKDVCGLHVPWNLQYLTPSENRRKGNKL